MRHLRESYLVLQLRKYIIVLVTQFKAIVIRGHFVGVSVLPAFTPRKPDSDFMAING